MIYLIITSSIENKTGSRNVEHRKKRYIDSIRQILSLIQTDASIKPIIVENNGLRETYLDGLSCDVVYTNNNVQDFIHKGVNELLDIKEVINKYNIHDDDTIIKLTGRYKVLNTNFIELVKNNIDVYDAFVKFFDAAARLYRFNDCVLGLFAIKCKYLKNFEYKCAKSPECEFAEHVRQNVNKIMEITDLKLECCFADSLRLLVL